MSVIAIIPARGGSKRIPRKNIKNFLGKPIISYPIELCLKSNIFDEVMVSTEDEEIASIAKSYGASVPFMRSKKNSGDFSTTKDVLMEVINKYNFLGQFFDNICTIYPCVPLLSISLLKKGYESFLNSELEVLFSVIKFSFPVQRSLILNENGTMSWREPEFKNIRTQDLSPVFHDAGAFYFETTKHLLENTDDLNNIAYFELDEMYAQDIDNESDWQIAELKYRLLNNV